MEKLVMDDLFREIVHRPKVLPISRVVKETPTIKTFYVDCPNISSTVRPGQFVMLWVIGADEIPMSVSVAKKNGELGMTVAKVGDATTRLHELGKGDQIGVRGPYGNWFDLSGNRLLMVGGGYGVAPLAFGTEVALSEGKKVTVILGAKTSDELLFRSRLEKLNVELKISTENGSAGVKSLATEVLENMLKRTKFDCIFACGPELMLKKTFDLSEKYKIPLQVSLERMMKCSVGLCGSCCVGPYRVCFDGPIFSADKLRKIKDEFGIFKRDASGRKIELRECV
ncbi:MAG: dihydroorotate dehydrogenase electron transfer subunit [Actinomycetota bacterium]|nr:dihydroorotate dehydrogenase electron transfer subunit [Actinomycetota bacterium]